MEIFKPARIGEILSQCGLVSQEGLERGLDVSATEGIRLGEALVRLGILDEDQLTWALGVQFDLSYVDLSEEMVDWEFLLDQPINHLREFMLLPMAQIDGVVHAVIADPTVEGRGEAIRKLFPHCRVDVQLASAHEITELLDLADVRRKQRGARVITGNDLGSNLIACWIKALESGTLDHLVLAPDAVEEGRYRVNMLSEFGDEPEFLSQGDLEEIIQLFDHYPSPPLLAPGGIYAIRAGHRGQNRRPIRAVFLTGSAGWLLALEAIPFEPPPVERAKTIVLFGADPSGIKARLFEEAARLRVSPSGGTSRVIASLETRIDFFANGIFQTEVADSATRVSIHPYILEAARPRVLVLEVESPDELKRISTPSYSSGGGTLIALVRAPMVRAEGCPAPAGWEAVHLSGGESEIRDSIRQILNGE